MAIHVMGIDKVLKDNGYSDAKAGNFRIPGYNSLGFRKSFLSNETIELSLR